VAPWARAGAGAVVTQGFAEVAYGPRGLEQLATGRPASDVLRALCAGDTGAALRQVAMVDASGRTALHTGAASVPAAGGREGEGYSVQGNMVASESVWEEMAERFESSAGTLADRMLAALDGAAQAGGDVRGRKSAALVVVCGTRSDAAWKGRLIDVRVDDHPEPLAELRRLVGLSSAYARLGDAQNAFARGDLETAATFVSEARALAPDEPDLSFWAGVAFVSAGRIDEGTALLRQVCARGAGWRELAARLERIGMLPAGIEIDPS
jgi:uncharacterized Ntn-hydrolase superfamily protein